MSIKQTKGLVDRMSQIKPKVREMGINPEGKGKIDLIHEIQRLEGNSPCYGFGLLRALI